MRTVLTLMFLTVGVSLANAEDASDAIAKEQKSLQGVWEATALMVSGLDGPILEKLIVLQLEFKGDKVVFFPDNREHTYHVDPAAKPKAMDLTPGDGEKKGERLPVAIYKLDGDTLTICIDKEFAQGRRVLETD